jgi:hypothetical protein
MQHPFAIAVQWPDSPRRFLVHLRKPYFTAAIIESGVATWLLVSWAPGTAFNDRPQILQNAAAFCQSSLKQNGAPIHFVEGKHGNALPRYLMAQSAGKELYIVEPDHCSPLVEVRENKSAAAPPAPKPAQRFDVVTQYRLAEMRKYYRQYLERQHGRRGQPAATSA